MAFHCYLKARFANPYTKFPAGEPLDMGTGNAHPHECSTASFASKKRYDEIKAFFEEHDVPCPRMIEQTLESVKINAQLWQRDGEVVCNFLHTLLH
ncbi:hypothetical protein TcWFU_007358 [Taenia crassiceps]|uniref:Uncharacterized protein n=1 Tax=Taenia crassiceps TaxID=6207 RepID=A0ABR4Q062_9CEST